MRKGFIFLILLAFNLLLIYGINQANVLMFNNNFMIYLNKEDKPIEETPNETEDPKKEGTFIVEYVYIQGKSYTHLIVKKVRISYEVI